MAVSKLQTVSSQNLAYSLTAETATSSYGATLSLSPAIYTITCVSSTVAYVEFWNSSGFIGKTNTVSGSANYNLATAATKIYYYTDTGSNVVISIEATGVLVTNDISAPTDILTTSQTYTGTGTAYVVVVGGGGGGGFGNNAQNYARGGGGGGSGGVRDVGRITLSGSTATVVGAAGTGGTNSVAATAGGTTQFGTWVSNGGAAGAGGGGGGGTPGGGNGAQAVEYGLNYNQVASPGTNATTSSPAINGFPTFFQNPGTTGGGSAQGASGAGGGIGTNGTGRAYGGNGGNMGGGNGTSGGPGAVYVLRYGS